MRTVWGLQAEDGLVECVFDTKAQCDAACADAARYGHGDRTPVALPMVTKDEAITTTQFWQATVRPGAAEAPEPCQRHAFSWEDYTPRMDAMLAGEPMEEWLGNGSCIVRHVSRRACEELVAGALERMRNARG